MTFLNLLFLYFFAVTQNTFGQQVFDKPAFYKVMASVEVADIDTELSIVKVSLIPEKQAYEGTLLMKKSGMIKKAKDKMSMFKEGRSKLEESIAKEKDCTEYRFLRLIIQEHAPKVVKYRNDIETDSKMIRLNYNTLSQTLQQAILDYSKKSTILKIP